VNWALARQRKWQVVLRIEDLDGPRVKPGASEQTMDLLKWLAIDWDEGPLYQLADLSLYEHALGKLAQQGAIYPCRCTRKNIEAASLSAPHTGDHELRYPGTCRPVDPQPLDLRETEQGETALRFRVPSGKYNFDDCFAGPQECDVQQSVGDFLVRTKAGLPSYQLAVVVDDAHQGIDQVVRGDDLLTSTPRQRLLYEMLNLGPVPSYTHLPLVMGSDGRRLAKRHGDSRLSHYRNQGVTAERVIGLLAEWCGLGPRQEMTPAEFLQEFQIERVSHSPIVFTEADDKWLLNKT